MRLLNGQVHVLALTLVMCRHADSAPTVNPNYTIGGALDPRYYSTTGAFNGSGIALGSSDFGIDSTLCMFWYRVDEVTSVDD